jgi:galactose mutarotase-like enzyme
VTLEDVVWRGEPGKRLRTDEVDVLVLPRRGAKIASLQHRPTGREWLEQPAGELRSRPEYGSSFTDADLFGWDEMVPTVIGGAYPDGPYKGTLLPDHGEVWTLPWETRREAEAVACQTTGRALPYQLTRTMRVDGSRLQLDYELASAGSAPLWVLWAAHPQFAAEVRGTRIILPAEVREVLDVTPGRTPEAVRWPSPDTESVLALPKGAGRKLYVLPDAHAGTAALLDADGAWLHMAWDPALVPYLGIWLDNGAYARHPVIALEPSTGYYDDLTLAVSNQRVPQIQPGRSLRWSVEVRLGTGQLP